MESRTPRRSPTSRCKIARFVSHEPAGKQQLECLRGRCVRRDAAALSHSREPPRELRGQRGSGRRASCSRSVSGKFGATQRLCREPPVSHRATSRSARAWSPGATTAPHGRGAWRVERSREPSSRGSARRPGTSSRSASRGRRGQRSRHRSLVDVARPDGAPPDGSSSRSALGGRRGQRGVEVSGASRSSFGRTLVDGAWLGCIPSRSPVGARARRGAGRRGDTRTRDETLLVMQRASAIDQRSDRFSCPKAGI